MERNEQHEMAEASAWAFDDPEYVTEHEIDARLIGGKGKRFLWDCTVCGRMIHRKRVNGRPEWVHR